MKMEMDILDALDEVRALNKKVENICICTWLYSDMAVCM